MAHISVLQEEVLRYLDPKPNEYFIDCTLGNGGHAFAILGKTAPRGKLLGIDWDPDAIARARTEAKQKGCAGRLILANDSYANLAEIIRQEKFPQPHGILLDLGLSSEQLEESKRGFTFRKQEPLDMRFNPGHSLTAEKVLNFWSRQDIEKIIKEYGGEQFAKEIAGAIIEQRTKKPLAKTSDLVDAVLEAIPKRWHRAKIHPATRTFQALRIAVNGELENIKRVLPQAVETLKPGGKIAVISFHSLEDKIVKEFFKEQTNVRILTKKPTVPAIKEIQHNPRARSAKLRAAEKLQTI
ncbi:MAG: 16S rRNA (cytosine(1402)-N(4))-methyltransferase RsmH [Candidatus Wildermuthbacteria bacterium]|nr:16S rRNA (cytosine(1402)-N(4))-methyltransferase RsmH [Candidatus Wildermuthbacteria bacterium]